MVLESYKKWVSLAVSLLLAGCGGSGGSGDTPQNTTPLSVPVSVQGAAQKGPFVINSTVLINQLTATGQATGETILTRTTDGIGNFTFSTTRAGAVQISVEGYHFNEITGTVSDGPLTLRAIYDVSTNGQQTAYVNVLTHLINNRVQKLLADGFSVASAISQAQQELLAALSNVLPPSQIQDFSRLSVYTVAGTDAAGNAYLLAFSATVYQYARTASIANGSNVTGELTLLLSRITSDLEDNGTVDAADIINGLRAANSQVNAAAVVANLSSHSASITGATLNIPDIANYFDNVTLTAPATGAVVSDVAAIRFISSRTTIGETYQLLVDGEIVETLSHPATQFDWNPYFWPAGPHTLLIRKAVPGGSFVDSNLVTVNVGSTAGVLPLAPVNRGYIASGATVALSWNSVHGAASYQLQVGTDSTFSNLVTTQTLSAPSYSLGQPASNAYYWRLRASNATGRFGAWSSVASFGVGVFSRSYNVSDESVRGAIQTADGGYAMLGAVSSGSDISLRRFDAAGNPLWFQSYGGPLVDFGTAFTQTADGGFVIVGVTESFGAGSSDVYVVKVDSAGEVLFTKTLGDAYRNRGTGIVDTGDGYLISAVSSEGVLPSTPYKLHEVIKLDLAGNESWRRTLFAGLAEFGQINSLRRTADGGFVICGAYDPSGGSGGGIAATSGAYLARLDSEGNFEWEKHFPFATDGIINGQDVVQTADGGYAINGQDFLGEATVVIKTDSLGAKQWYRVHAGFYSGGTGRQLERSGGNIIAVGTNAGQSANPVLLNIAADGNQNWRREYGGSGSRHARSVLSTSDGGFILSGVERNGTQDFTFLIKTNALGESVEP
jgi:hypothetical protein